MYTAVLPHQVGVVGQDWPLAGPEDTSMLCKQETLIPMASILATMPFLSQSMLIGCGNRIFLP